MENTLLFLNIFLSHSTLSLSFCVNLFTHSVFLYVCFQLEIEVSGKIYFISWWMLEEFPNARAWWILDKEPFLFEDWSVT